MCFASDTATASSIFVLGFSLWRFPCSLDPMRAHLRPWVAIVSPKVVCPGRLLVGLHLISLVAQILSLKFLWKDRGLLGATVLQHPVTVAKMHSGYTPTPADRSWF